MTRTHEIKLDGYGAHTTLADDRPVMLLGTAESYGIEMLHIVPGKDWEGLTITATFNAADGTSTDVLMGPDGNIAVPTEATVKSGSGRIVFAGVSNGIQRISCDLDYFVVAHSAINGAQSGGTAPSWFEQAVTRFMPTGGTAGQVLTKLTDTDFEAKWQDSKGGAGGITPTIGDNGNWFLGDTDTGKPSRGKDGKSAYSYAQDGGYTGTEAEFAAKLAAEGLDKALYVVNLTMNSDGTYSADKTFGEITWAYNEGKYNIVAHMAGMGNFIIPLLAIGNGALFSAIIDGGIALIYITSNNEVQTEMLPLATLDSKLPNPYPLTFTGAVSETYDGSSAKTITIPSGGVHSDWNQNDSTAADYIKNRPFYMGDPVETVLVEESTASFTDSNQGFYMAQIQSNFAPTVGETYKVSWDGTVYECTCVSVNRQLAIGNLSIAGAGSDTGEPFIVGVMGNGEAMIYTLDTSASHTFSINGFVAEVVKIDEKYINKDTSGYIVIHHNSIMTEEEARKYARDLNANEVGFIIWGNIYIIKLSFIGNARTLQLINLNGEEYSITKNYEGLYDYNDIKLSGSRFPYGFESLTIPANINSDGTKIQISPESFFEGMGTTDTVFCVLPNGSKSKPFEVLGNGMAVTPALILYSSTTGSTKKFKITVDDSGTISATEVV